MKLVHLLAAIALNAVFTTPFAAAQTTVKSPTSSSAPDSTAAATTIAAATTTAATATNSAATSTKPAASTVAAMTTPPPSPANVFPPLPGLGTIADKLASDKRFTSLLNSVSTAGFLQDFMSQGPLTLFAPTNTAFEQIQDLIDTFSIEELKLLIAYHAASGYVFFTTNGLKVTTLNGAEVTLTVGTLEIKVNNANVDRPMLASNGIIYVIDKVLIPSSLQPPTAAPTPLPSGFTSLERITPVFFQGCMDVDGDGQNDDSIKLGTCSSTKPSQEFTYNGTYIHPGGDTTKCLQAGRLDTPQNGKYMRVYDCDDSNILQRFSWDFRNSGRIQLTGEWSAFCVVFRGVEENLDVDPIILQRCEALSERSLEWKIW